MPQTETPQPPAPADHFVIYIDQSPYCYNCGESMYAVGATCEATG